MTSGKQQVKAWAAAKLPPVFPPIPEEAIGRALKTAAFESDELTARMIAREIGKAEPTVYHKIEDPEKLSLSEFCAIVRLATSKGVTSLIELLIPDGYLLIESDYSDEALDTCVAHAVRDMGETLRDVERNHFDGAERAARKANRDTQKLLAQTKKLKGGK